MPTYEGLRLKIREYDRKLFGDRRQQSLINKEFTILSNNCWGGEVYEYYHLQKQSPTVGLFFMADDYIRFIAKAREYLNAPLSFIRTEESRWLKWPQVSDDRRFGHYPVGVLSLGEESIEVFFLHYHSEEEARSKWERRCARVRWDKLIVKFNDQNGCTDDHIQTFIRADYAYKVFFTCKRWNVSIPEMPGMWYQEIHQFPRRDSITASYEPLNWKVTALINGLS